MARPSLVAGVDLSGTNLQFGIVDDSGAIVGRSRGKTEADRGLDAIVANVSRGVHEACAAAGTRLDELAAIGIAAAGAIDISRGVVLKAPNMGLVDVPLRDILSREVGRPVVLDNDVNAAAWGEFHYGAGRGATNLLGVWVGTGVGGGLVFGQRPYQGSFFTAGEIGHTVVDPNGPSGARTVEDLCSRTGMQRALGADLDTAAIKAGYESGNVEVHRVVDRSAQLLGLAIANWVTVLSLDTIVLGGGITESLAEPFITTVRASFDEVVFPPECRACRLIPTALAADAGILGAALLARSH